ncbi:MAG: chaperone NapD [Coriobacteriales bacterium]|jgi:nitrate reductase NapAB chaperone NapD|nr:chaperone NapD [Coriobacteriales bacterium]
MDEKPVVISSYLASIEPGRLEEVEARLACYDGVEVHGVEHGQLVVSIEAASLDATYERAVEITRLDGVTTFSLVYCNFEDEQP